MNHFHLFFFTPIVFGLMGAPHVIQHWLGLESGIGLQMIQVKWCYRSKMLSDSEKKRANHGGIFV